MSETRSVEQPRQSEERQALFAKDALLGFLRKKHSASNARVKLPILGDLEPGYEVLAQVVQFIDNGQHAEAILAAEAYLAQERPDLSSPIPEKKESRETLPPPRIWAAAALPKDTLLTYANDTSNTKKTDFKRYLISTNETNQKNEKHREGGRDAALFRPDIGLFGAFDGVSTSIGDVPETIRQAIAIIEQEVETIPLEEPENHQRELWYIEIEQDVLAIAEHVRDALIEENQRRKDVEPPETPLGQSTMVFCVVRGDRVFSANMGDSTASVYHPHAQEGERTEVLSTIHDSIFELYGQYPDILKRLRTIQEERDNGLIIDGFELPKPDIKDVHARYDKNRRLRERQGGSKPTKPERSWGVIYDLLQRSDASRHMFTPDEARLFIPFLLATASNIGSGIGQTWVGVTNPIGISVAEFGPDDILEIDTDGTQPIKRSEKEHLLETIDEPADVVAETMSLVAERTKQKHARAKAGGDDTTKLVIKRRTAEEARVAYREEIQNILSALPPELYPMEQRETIELALEEALAEPRPYDACRNARRILETLRQLQTRKTAEGAPEPPPPDDGAGAEAETNPYQQYRRIFEIMQANWVPARNAEGDPDGSYRWIQLEGSDAPDITGVASLYGEVASIPNPLYGKEISAEVSPGNIVKTTMQQKDLFFAIRADAIDDLPRTLPTEIKGNLQAYIIERTIGRNKAQYTLTEHATPLQREREASDGQWEMQTLNPSFAQEYPYLLRAGWSVLPHEEVGKWRNGHSLPGAFRYSYITLATLIYETGPPVYLVHADDFTPAQLPQEARSHMDKLEVFTPHTFRQKTTEYPEQDTTILRRIDPEHPEQLHGFDANHPELNPIYAHLMTKGWSVIVPEIQNAWQKEGHFVHLTPAEQRREFTFLAESKTAGKPPKKIDCLAILELTLGDYEVNFCQTYAFGDPITSELLPGIEPTLDTFISADPALQDLKKRVQLHVLNEIPGQPTKRQMELLPEPEVNEPEVQAEPAAAEPSMVQPTPPSTQQQRPGFFRRFGRKIAGVAAALTLSGGLYSLMDSLRSVPRPPRPAAANARPAPRPDTLRQRVLNELAEQAAEQFSEARRQVEEEANPIKTKPVHEQAFSAGEAIELGKQAIKLRVPITGQGIQLSVRDALENYLLNTWAGAKRGVLTRDELARAREQANQAVRDAVLSGRATGEKELPNDVRSGFVEEVSFNYDATNQEPFNVRFKGSEKEGIPEQDKPATTQTTPEKPQSQVNIVEHGTTFSLGDQSFTGGETRAYTTKGGKTTTAQVVGFSTVYKEKQGVYVAEENLLLQPEKGPQFALPATPENLSRVASAETELFKDDNIMVEPHADGSMTVTTVKASGPGTMTGMGAIDALTVAFMHTKGLSRSVAKAEAITTVFASDDVEVTDKGKVSKQKLRDIKLFIGSKITVDTKELVPKVILR